MAELTELQKQLFELQDIKYRDFHSKLMPETAKEKIIGIRTPVLRNFAKVFAGTPELEDFLQQLPHQFYEADHWDKGLSEMYGRSTAIPALYRQLGHL